MKVCSICQEEKSTDQFGPDKGKASGLRTACKPCWTTYQREYYHIRKGKDPSFADKKRGYRKVAYDRNKRFVWDYLLEHPCADCDESDPVVLDFDHQSDKMYNVSEMIWNSSLTKIKQEISKCEVRCSNCHRRRTSEQLGWFNGYC